MTKIHSNPVPENRQDTDSAIVAMLDELLAQDDLCVQVDFRTSEYALTTVDGQIIVDVYDTRAAAYRAAIDCIIEYSISAWDGAE